jgi:hypothetical protein
MDLVASKYEITLEIPLAKGARSARGSAQSVITDVLRQPDGVDIILRGRKANLLFDRSNSSSPMAEFISGNKRLYVLRNKKKNEAVVQSPGNPDLSALFASGSILVNQAVRVSFGAEKNSSSSEPVVALTPEWLADAELVRLDLTPAFEFSKRVVVEDFKMDSSGPKHAR